MNSKLLYQWTNELARHLPSLNQWQVSNVGLFSYGIICAQSCQQQDIARQICCGEQVESSARRLRRFLDNETVDLNAVFSQWTRWVIKALKGRHITLLVDETKISDRVAAMVVGVAWEGRCIPLAWRCYTANCAATYPSEGQVEMIMTLLRTVKAGLPANRTVLVLADRGIGTSPALCRQVAAMEWTYLFRVTKQSKICTEQGEYTVAQTVQPGELWSASGKVFKKRGQIPAYALALWQEGYDEPWALVTNDNQLTGYEYAQRNWQEQSFRDLKSHGWQWNASYIRHPDHMARLFLLLVVAYTWMLALGSYAVHWGRSQPLQRHPDGRLRRHWSLFKEGLRLFIEYVQRHTVCLKLCFVPDKRFI